MKHPHPKTLDVIRRAREIISDPAHWTQCAEALDDQGIRRHARHAKARYFSATAALYRAAQELIDSYASAQLAAHDAEHAINTRHGRIVRFRNLDQTNDELGHEAVLELLDEALACGRVVKIFAEAPVNWAE